MPENDLIKKKLENYFKKDNVNTKEAFNQLSLFIFSLEDKNSDLYMLAKLLPEDLLYKLINYFDGSVLKIPTKSKYQEALLLALVFYFYEIKKLSWDEIKEIMKLDKIFPEYSTISLGKRIVKIKKVINKQLSEEISRLDLNSVMRDMLEQ